MSHACRNQLTHGYKLKVDAIEPKDCGRSAVDVMESAQHSMM